MEIDHIGVVVEDMPSALNYYTSTYGFCVDTAVLYDPNQDSQLAMLVSESGQRLELIQPAGPTAPSRDFLQKGGGLQHICFRVPHLDEAIERLKGQGLFLFKRPVAAPLLGGRRVAFLFSRFDKQIIELVETEGH